MQNNDTSVTLDDLAGMIKTGFDEAGRELKDFRTEVDKRFDRIENLTVTDHRHRLEYLELEVQRIKDMFAFK